MMKTLHMFPMFYEHTIRKKDVRSQNGFQQTLQNPKLLQFNKHILVNTVHFPVREHNILVVHHKEEVD